MVSFFFVLSFSILMTHLFESCSSEFSHEYKLCDENAAKNSDTEESTGKEDISTQEGMLGTGPMYPRGSWEANHRNYKGIPNNNLTPLSISIEVGIEINSGSVLVWVAVTGNRIIGPINNELDSMLDHLYGTHVLYQPTVEGKNDNVQGEGPRTSFEKQTAENTPSNGAEKQHETFYPKESSRIVAMIEMQSTVKHKADKVFFGTDRHELNPKLLETLDIHALGQKAISYSEGSVDENISGIMHNIILLLIRELDLEKQEHLLPVSFEFELFDKMVKPLGNGIMLNEKVVLLDFFTKELIKNLNGHKDIEEYSRRAMSLMCQFKQEIALQKWKKHKHDIPENVKIIASLLKIEERWPIFSDYDATHLKSLQEKMRSLNEEEKHYLSLMFLNKHQERLSIIEYTAESKMRAYKFFFSDEEIQSLTISGISIPLLLQLDLALELSCEEINWKDLSEKNKHEKVNSVYLAINGMYKTKEVAFQLRDSHWGFSPIKELILSRPLLSKRFESRIKLLVSFFMSHPSMTYGEWIGTNMSEPWAKQSLSFGEILAASYVGIQAKDLEKLKYWYGLDGLKLKLRANLEATNRIPHNSAPNQAQRSNTNKIIQFNILKWWPKMTEDQTRIEGLIAKERENFIKYFDLLNISILNDVDRKV